MITSLNVVFPEKCGKIRGFFNRLRGDKVCVEIKRARGVSVKQLTYICRRQKVNLNKIDRAIGNQRTRLLCCEEMIFPNDSGYKRFYSPLFSARLCTNMALFALSKFDTPERLTVGIYDPDAQCTDLVSFVLKYTGNACIITDNEDVFYDELNTIAEETGALSLIHISEPTRPY